MHQYKQFLSVWWNSLIQPEKAGQIVLSKNLPKAFDLHLALTTILLYSFYGGSMGLYRSFGGVNGIEDNFIPFLPAIVSSIKLPLLFGFSIFICYPALYVLNCLIGPKLTFFQCFRLLLFSGSTHAIAISSYSFFSYFFVFTTSLQGYNFLVLMHVCVFAAAGFASLIVINVIFRATAKEAGKPLRTSFLATWGTLYAFVGMQMSWCLRPWIGNRNIQYEILREQEGSFYESVWNLIVSQL